MEDNKYYVPSIEEFHVGFEYEAKETFKNGTVKTQEDFNKFKWIKEQAKIGSFPYINRALYGTNADNGICGIRVKYLDREDIESLGFKESTYRDVVCYKKGRYVLFWFGELIVSLDVFVEHSLHLVRKFRLKIKNISELKKILKQAGVLDEKEQS